MVALRGWRTPPLGPSRKSDASRARPGPRGAVHPACRRRCARRRDSTPGAGVCLAAVRTLTIGGMASAGDNIVTRLLDNLAGRGLSDKLALRQGERTWGYAQLSEQ